MCFHFLHFTKLLILNRNSDSFQLPLKKEVFRLRKFPVIPIMDRFIFEII